MSSNSGLVSIRRVLAGLVMVVLAATATGSTGNAASRGHLYAFRSDGELTRFLRRQAGQDVRGGWLAKPSPPVLAAPPPPPPPPSMAPSPAAPAEAPSELSGYSDIVVTASKAAEPSITNTQEANVDEGGIVKAQGEILVVLRRGRLFTVSVADGGLRAIDQIDAYPPGADGDGWYDEMLLVDGWIVVIGYSYEASATELNRFRLSDDGRLTYVDSYYLRSDDYYSSDNYASRLIGRDLVFYTPLPLWWDEDPLEVLPGLRKRDPENPDGKFNRTAQAQRIYVAADLRRDPEAVDTLHSVTTCRLTAPTLKCSSMGVLGPDSSSFYVSSTAVYLWVGDEWTPRRKGFAASQIYRLPFDENDEPGAIGVRGGPINQFSFREDRRDGVLNVLVTSDGEGDRMWNAQFTDGALALVRAPLSAFGDGRSELDAGRYRILPSRWEHGGSLTNRYVGEYLLYGLGNDWGEPDTVRSSVWAVPLAGGPITELALPQAVDRIEITGRDAMVVGGDAGKNLIFSSVDLTAGAPPRLGDRYLHPKASEGETRSHAFFYSPDLGSPNGDSGVLGLPVSRPGRPAFNQLFENSAAMLYLRRLERRLSPLGELAASTDGFVDDGCVASCSDWYGNARPIFMKGRVFALLGYELVEGRIEAGTIRESRRVNFAPVRKAAAGR